MKLTEVKPYQWILFSVNIAILIFFWIFTAVYYNQLPARIPMHFGIDGMADAFWQTNFWTAFFCVILQTFVIGLTAASFFWPQIANVPYSLTILALPDKQKEYLKSTIRSWIQIIMILVNILIGYLSYSIIAIALKWQTGLSPWIMWTTVGLILVIAITYSVWFSAKVVKIKKQNAKQS